MPTLGDIQNELKPELGSGERLLWSGMPRQGVVFQAIDLFLIPFFLVWIGVPLAAVVGMLASGKPHFPASFILPFVIIGASMLVGRFIVDAKQRAHTFYAVTDQRILIVVAWRKRRTTSIKLKILPDVTLTEGRSGRGLIQFGADRWPGASFFGTGWPGAGQYMSPRLDLADDVRRVYDIVIKAQREAS